MNKCFFILVMLLISAAVRAQTDTIGLHGKRLVTSALKPGLNQYLIYFQDTKKHQELGFWFWLRDIKITDRKGEKVFTINQHWYGSDSASYRTVYSVNRVADFSPVYHAEFKRGKLFAYNWDATRITGADTAAQNSQKGFSLDLKTPNLNWNLDIETFEMLPLAAGKTFMINFYDAGLDLPQYVAYKVTGSETIATLNNDLVDCWTLVTESDYKGKHYSETYWISKKDHEFLKEEDAYPGGYRYKVKMTAALPDITTRFVN
jgi:hypothetical protein